MTGSDATSVVDLPPFVTAQTVVGEMLLPDGDAVVTRLILDNRSWEQVESAALTALIKRGANVVDVGAHVGYMTLLAAARVGPSGSVLAIEAHPGNFSLLQENIKRNGLTNVRALHGAAWRRSDERRTLTISQENSGDHRVFRRDGATDTLEVPSIALDDVLDEARPIDVVKIDAQGTDHVALEGMRRTLARCRPVVVVEFWPPGIEEFGDSPQEVLACYRELGYEIVMLEAPALAPDAHVDELVERARQCPGEFCTLVLQPIRQKSSSEIYENVELLLARGPVAGPRSALGPVGPMIRRIALRLMKPHTAYQRTLDGEVALALRELSDRLDALERRGEERAGERG